MASGIGTDHVHNAFVTHLVEFDLTKQEAECYYYLLKNGPTTLPTLTTALNADRGAVSYSLIRLIEEDMVRPSLRSPTEYAAVELSTALETMMRRRAYELQMMKTRERELIGYAQQYHWRHSSQQ